MKYLWGAFLGFALIFSSQALAGDAYDRCLAEHYQSNAGLAKCANEETIRVMVALDKRYEIVSAHKYFLPWNGALHSFSDLKKAWIKYRDDYCNLLGYSELHADNDYGHVSEARCRLRETLNFREEIEALVKNYQKTLKSEKGL